MGKNKTGYAKVIMLVIFISSVAAPLTQFKVPPMMQQLMQALDISLVTSAWLMSVFSLVGIILALPAGQITQRLGLKTTGLIALAALIIGSLVGILSTNAAIMLASRVIEGIGMCFLSVMAPAALTAWYPPEKRSLPMGIWATWVPIGTILMYNIAPALGGWKSVWVFSLVFSAVAFVLMLLLFRMPGEGEVAMPKATAAQSQAASKSPYMNKYIWMLAFSFFIFNLMALAVNSFMPMFLKTVQNMSDAKASSTASILMIAAMIMAPVSGIMISKIKSYKKIMVSGFIIATVSTFFIFSSSGAMLIALIVITGMMIGMVPTAIFSAVPEIMEHPSMAGIGMSIVAFGRYVGMFTGPVVAGAVIQNYGWDKVGIVVAPMVILAAVVAAFIKVR